MVATAGRQTVSCQVPFVGERGEKGKTKGGETGAFKYEEALIVPRPRQLGDACLALPPLPYQIWTPKVHLALDVSMEPTQMSFERGVLLFGTYTPTYNLT
ncbi:hypothetical protein PG993_006697 [Apiospora rasikravindrae]|uniref:Uncharacterized protein n=1 Tax=Apiospora rasikravindrae TaxID=990691 RepID=A0ABR1T6G3_9PEZI